MSAATFRVVYLEDLDPGTVEVIRAHLPTDCAFGCLRDGTAAELLADADALIAGHHPAVDDALLALAPRLRLVQRQGVGYDTIDTDALAARGIRLALVTVGAQEVAEHAVMLLLACLRRLVPTDRDTRGGQWPHRWSRVRARSLADRRVAIVGMGRTGQAVAGLLGAFGTSCRYTGRRRVDEAVEARLGLTFQQLPDLLDWADVLTLHVPATRDTRGMIGADELARLGPEGVLINTSRGGLVDQDALIAALGCGRLGRAGLDVFAEEPLGPDSQLDLDTTVLTPHLAGGTVDADARKLGAAMANIARFRRGDALRDEVAVAHA